MLLPEGKYEVEVVDAYMTESKNGTPGLVFRFENLQGHQEVIRYVTPATTDFVIKDLETMGFPRAKLSDMANLDKLKEFVKGNSVRIVVEDEEYEGNVTPKVKWINPPGAMKKETPQLKQNIFAVLNGKAPALTSAPRSRAAASEPPPNTPMDIEDVPF